MGVEQVIEKGGKYLTKIDGEDYYAHSWPDYPCYNFCLKADEIDWIDARDRFDMTKAKR